MGHVRSRFFTHFPANTLLYLQKIPLKSLFCNILPVSCSDSIFCGDFRGFRGRRCWWGRTRWHGSGGGVRTKCRGGEGGPRRLGEGGGPAWEDKVIHAVSGTGLSPGGGRRGCPPFARRNHRDMRMRG